MAWRFLAISEERIFSVRGGRLAEWREVPGLLAGAL